jgi:thiamine pyrophosphokinase
LSFYEPHVDVLKDGNQYSTDLGKSLQHVYTNGSDGGHVVILGSLGGRVDQGLGMLNEIYRNVLLSNPPSPETKPTIPQNTFWIVSETNLSFVLPPGENTLKGLLATKSGDAQHQVFAESVGILPLFGPAVISTSGLEWDVENWNTSMGGQVSTSNHVVKDEVMVKTDFYVLFTIEIGDWRLGQDTTK